MPHTFPLALLADRDADSRQMYGQYLQYLHWRTEEAVDGREALAKAIRNHPDVIVTETRLLGMSGYDLCTILHRNAATRTIPIIVVTGDAFVEDVARAYRSGADAVLTKPCLPDALFAEIQRLIANTSRQRASAGRERGRAHAGRSSQLHRKSLAAHYRMLGLQDRHADADFVKETHRER